MIYYKSLTADNKSWHDGKTAWLLGQPMPPLSGEKGPACGVGYHLAKTPQGAIRYGRFPFTLYAAEPCGDLLGEDGDKARFTSAKIVKALPKPVWAKRAEKFIASVPSIKYLAATGKVSRKWRMYDTRAAAWAAAWDAARDAAGDAAWDAAGDAAGAARLQAYMEICCDLDIPKKHRDHARERWRVWQAGYGLLCDVDGVLYCYRRVS